MQLRVAVPSAVWADGLGTIHETCYRRFFLSSSVAGPGMGSHLGHSGQRDSSSMNGGSPGAARSRRDDSVTAFVAMRRRSRAS